jgi:hypothetical protein
MVIGGMKEFDSFSQRIFLLMNHKGHKGHKGRERGDFINWFYAFFFLPLPSCSLCPLWFLHSILIKSKKPQI